MKKISVFVVFGLLILETYGASYRYKRQTDVDDKKDNKLDDRYGIWDSHLQYPTPGWNNPGGQPWGQPQYPYPGLPQYPGLGQPWGQPQYPYPGVPGGQPWYPGQPTYPGLPWYPGQPGIPGQPWLPGTGSTNLTPTDQPIVIPTSSPTESTTGSVGDSLANAQCIRNCLVTSEYNPVCGTDNVTYENPGRLECAKACGANIEVARKSRCPAAAS